jgi:GMP synthase (glutamine-hydrolysing)
MILVVYFDVFIEDLKKRLIEHNIAYEVVKYADLEHYKPPERIRHVIIAGSKQRVLRRHDFPLLDPFLAKDVYVIGICFGFQWLAYKSGGKVVEGKLFKGRRPTDEGRRPTDEGRRPQPTDQGLRPKSLGLYFNHHDRVLDLPDDWTVIQRIGDFINIAATKKWLGFQFHPEKDDVHFRHYLLPFLRI